MVLGYLGFPHRKDCVWAGSSEEMALNAVLGHSASSVVHDKEHNQAGDTYCLYDLVVRITHPLNVQICELCLIIIFTLSNLSRMFLY